MERFSYKRAAPDVYNTMLGVHRYLEHCGLDDVLLDLVYLRASQINGCAYCIDMHWKDLRAAGQSEQKLYMLSAWREWPEYSARERAALAWTEAVTELRDADVSDVVYEAARREFSEADLAKLTLAVAAINSWNRLNLAFRTTPGGYQPPHVSDVGSQSATVMS
jgi:AhpD family alkylhydroperoxidase